MKVHLVHLMILGFSLMCPIAANAEIECVRLKNRAVKINTNSAQRSKDNNWDCESMCLDMQARWDSRVLLSKVPTCYRINGNNDKAYEAELLNDEVYAIGDRMNYKVEKMCGCRLK